MSPFSQHHFSIFYHFFGLIAARARTDKTVCVGNGCGNIFPIFRLDEQEGPLRNPTLSLPPPLQKPMHSETSVMPFAFRQGRRRRGRIEEKKKKKETKLRFLEVEEGLEDGRTTAALQKI